MCVCVQRVAVARQMLDRLRACVVASYYGRVMQNAQNVSHCSLLSCLVLMLEISADYRYVVIKGKSRQKLPIFLIGQFELAYY